MPPPFTPSSGDIDVLIEPTFENATKARSAIRDWGDFDPQLSSEELISGDILKISSR